MDSVIFNVDYLVGDDISGEYAEAAITSNPNITWIKFVFTDDQPNGNKQRIAQSEFANIIKSGVHMPIKMQIGNPDGEHLGSVPIGTITNLTHPKGTNKIVGLAALWEREREEDVALLKEKYSQGEPLNLSWELFYAESEEVDNGVVDLKGTTVCAITFVGNPAYQGRTNVLSMAEKTKEEPELDQEQYELKIKELTDRVQELSDALESKTEEADKVVAERDELAAWKSEREAEAAQAELLKTRRETLAEAGVVFTDEEFSERTERIANMSEADFEFYMQDLVAFAKKAEEAAKKADSSKKTDSDAPDVPGNRVVDNYALVLESLTKSNKEN